MNKIIFPLVLAAALFVSAEVRPQVPIPPSPTVKLTAEQDHVIKEIVLKDFNFPKAAAAEYKIGDAIPGDVALQNFPDIVISKVSPVRAHKFFLSGDKIVVVDPKDNKIADVIE